MPAPRQGQAPDGSVPTKTINHVTHDFQDGSLRQADATRGRHRRGVDVVVNYTGGDTCGKSPALEGRRPVADLVVPPRATAPPRTSASIWMFGSEGAGFQRLDALRRRGASEAGRQASPVLVDNKIYKLEDAREVRCA